MGPAIETDELTKRYGRARGIECISMTVEAGEVFGLVTFGVRAIEKQTEPIDPLLRDITGALEQVAAALEAVAQPSPPPKAPAG